MGLGTVLNNLETKLGSQRHNWIHIGRHASEMYNNDGPRTIGNKRSMVSGVIVWEFSSASATQSPDRKHFLHYNTFRLDRCNLATPQALLYNHQVDRLRTCRHITSALVVVWHPDSRKRITMQSNQDHIPRVSITIFSFSRSVGMTVNSLWSTNPTTISA